MRVVISKYFLAASGDIGCIGRGRADRVLG